MKSCLPPVSLFLSAHCFFVEQRRERLLYRTDPACGGVGTSRTTLRKLIFRWQEQRSLENKHRSGQLPKITREIADYLEKQLEEDDELSSEELQRLVSQKFAMEISSPTIQRYLCISLQWAVVRKTYKCVQQSICKVNFLKLVSFCTV